MNPDPLIWEPSGTAGDVEMLLFSLDRARALFAWKAGDLDAGGLRQAFPPSTMTLGGLVKRLALVERLYAIDFAGEAPGPPLDDPAAREDADWVWRSAADDEPDYL